MREIKFRAWDERDKKLLEVNSIDYLCNQEGIWVVCFGGRRFKVDLKNLMQFTGLKDKNGKEIFDGYIVEFKYNSKEKQKGETIFIGGSFKIKSEKGIYYLFCKEIMKNVEVIGNLYENPELLEEKK